MKPLAKSTSPFLTYFGKIEAILLTVLTSDAINMHFPSFQMVLGFFARKARGTLHVDESLKIEEYSGLVEIRQVHGALNISATKGIARFFSFMTFFMVPTF